MEMIKFTALDDVRVEIPENSTTSSCSPKPNGGPAPNGHHHPDYSVPPKPPPRSTSIYHLNQVKMQSNMKRSSGPLDPDLVVNHQRLEQPLNSSELPSEPPQPILPTSSSSTSIFKNVIMRRDKNKKKTKARPKSDIYAIAGTAQHGAEPVAGTSSGSISDQQRFSLYCDDRPVRHAISRVSTFDFSVSRPFFLCGH